MFNRVLVVAVLLIAVLGAALPASANQAPPFSLQATPVATPCAMICGGPNHR